jgi:serine/threonine protein kinase
MLALCKTVSSEIDSSKVEFLENGSFGAVKSAKYEGKVFARKIIPKSKMGPTHHFEIKGDNILKMIGHCFMDQDKQNVILLFDILNKGSLRELIEKEPDLINSKQFEIAQGIASGLAHLHKIDFIHKDFRPANIFISNEYVPKIRCINLAREGLNHNCLDYMPPEYYTSKYDQKSDVFSFGLILNELFNGKHKLNDERIEIVEECDVIFDLFVSNFIEHKPENRPNARTTNQIFSFINSFILRQINLNKEYFSASYDNSKRNQDFEQYFMKGYECYTETKLKDSKRRDKANTKKKLDFYLEELENTQAYKDPNRTELIYIIDSVSFLYGCLEDVENSIKYAELSFEKRKDISEFQLAIGYAGLGCTYLKTAKKPQEAKSYYKQALDLLSKIFLNKQNPYTASWNFKLGCCCVEMNELDEAIEYHRKSYEMSKSIYEPGSYYILKSLEALVDCFSKKNDTDSFFAFRKDLIGLKKSIFISKYKNKEYKDVVLFKGNENEKSTWAFVRIENEEKYQETKKKEKLGIFTNVDAYGKILKSGLGENPPGLLSSQLIPKFGYEKYKSLKLNDEPINLDFLNDENGNYPVLGHLFSNLKKNMEFFNEENNEEIFNSLLRLSSYFWVKLSDTFNSIRYTDKCGEIGQNIFPKNEISENILNLKHLKAWCEIETNTELAKNTFEECLTLRKSLYLTENHPWVASTYLRIGDCYLELKNYKDALENYQKCLDIRRTIYKNETNIYIEFPLGKIVDIFLKENDYDNSLKYAKELYSVKKEMLKIKHPEKKYNMVILIRGSDNGRPAWYYVLVEDEEKYVKLKMCKKGTNIDVTDFGKIIRSGWGQDPSKKIKDEIINQYGES